jgi:hypothetical protein
MTILKNHIDMRPIQHRLDEHRRRLSAADQAAKDAASKNEPPTRAPLMLSLGCRQGPLTRARLITAIEQIKLICEAHEHTDSAKVDLIHGLARQLVEQWNNEDE